MVVSCCCCSDLLCLSGFWGEFKTRRPQIPADVQRDVLHKFFFPEPQCVRSCFRHEWFGACGGSFICRGAAGKVGLVTIQLRLKASFLCISALLLTSVVVKEIYSPTQAQHETCGGVPTSITSPSFTVLDKINGKISRKYFIVHLLPSDKAASAVPGPQCWPEARRVRGRDRQPLRPPEHRHHRHRQHRPERRQGAGPQGLWHGLHPDRRHHQCETETRQETSESSSAKKCQTEFFSVFFSFTVRQLRRTTG